MREAGADESDQFMRLRRSLAAALGGSVGASMAWAFFQHAPKMVTALGCGLGACLGAGVVILIVASFEDML